MAYTNPGKLSVQDLMFLRRAFIEIQAANNVIGEMRRDLKLPIVQDLKDNIKYLDRLIEQKYKM